MGTKKEKVDDINKALKRVKSTSYAELLDDGTIQYIKMATSARGKYKVRATFSDMLSAMHGEDMRLINKKYGRVKSKK